MNDADRKYFMDKWKDATKEKYTYMATFDTCGRSCALCKNPSNLQRCGRCFRVFYCSKDCQRSDWHNHRHLCLEVTAHTTIARQEGTKPEVAASGDAKEVDGEEEPAFGPVKTCRKCKRSGMSFKTCAQCSSAIYCSKQCQREDWRQHKKECKKAAKSKIESDWEAGKMFQEFFQAIDPSLTLNTRRSRKPALSWKQAIQGVRKLHPDKIVLTKLRDVMEEEDLDPVLMTSTVFLAQLVKPHPYIVRHAWYLEDIKGQQVRIFFYLDHDVPEPYFKWQQLDCGNFLCLEHAYIHTFMDGTTGIRVDDACDVSIIGD